VLCGKERRLADHVEHIVEGLQGHVGFRRQGRAGDYPDSSAVRRTPAPGAGTRAHEHRRRLASGAPAGRGVYGTACIERRLIPELIDRKGLAGSILCLGMPATGVAVIRNERQASWDSDSVLELTVYSCCDVDRESGACVSTPLAPYFIGFVVLKAFLAPCGSTRAVFLGAPSRMWVRMRKQS